MDHPLLECAAKSQYSFFADVIRVLKALEHIIGALFFEGEFNEAAHGDYHHGDHEKTPQARNDAHEAS